MKSQLSSSLNPGFSPSRDRFNSLLNTANVPVQMNHFKETPSVRKPGSHIPTTTIEDYCSAHAAQKPPRDKQARESGPSPKPSKNETPRMPTQSARRPRANFLDLPRRTQSRARGRRQGPARSCPPISRRRAACQEQARPEPQCLAASPSSGGGGKG